MYNSSNNFNHHRPSFPTNSPSPSLPGHNSNTNQAQGEIDQAHGHEQSHQQSQPPYDSSLPSRYLPQLFGGFHNGAPYHSAQAHSAQFSEGYYNESRENSHTQAHYNLDLQTPQLSHSSYRLGHSTTDLHRPSASGHGVQARQILHHQSTPASHSQSIRTFNTHDSHNSGILNFRPTRQADTQPRLNPQTNIQLDESRASYYSDPLGTSQLHPPALSQKRAQNDPRNHITQLPSTADRARKKNRPRNTEIPSTADSSLPAPIFPPTSTATRTIVNQFLPKSLLGARSQSSPEFPIMTSEAMMSKSSAELRILSKKHSKGDTVPPGLHNHFMRLYDEFDKALAINCLNNQVSCDAVHKLWYMWFIHSDFAFYISDEQLNTIFQGPKEAAERAEQLAHVSGQ